MFFKMISRARTSVLVPTLFATFLFLPLMQRNDPQAPTIYYVSCTGSDSNTGKSPSQAWKTLAKANAAPLLPGDSILFKRGCAWLGTLNAKWNGTDTQKITIGAYGDGALPVIKNKGTDLADGYHNNVKITGSYLIIENIATKIVNPPVDPGCLNNPIGFFVGFNFINANNTANGGSNNILRYSSASFHMAGVHMQNNTHHNQVLNSTFTNNNVMNVLTPTPGNDDLGAWGILLKGNDHEIANNYFSGNNAKCTYDTNPQGNSVELYQAKNNTIHHNVAVNDRVFSELGGSAGYLSENNLYAYNLIVSSIVDARFITTRGAQSEYGPVYNTQLFQNTVYFTGAQSQGLVCGAGCNANMLTARNNIFWAQEKSAYADGAFPESNNVYWRTGGSPNIQFVGFSIDPSSKKANPQFFSIANSDFRLKSTSPAINKGMAFGWLYDLAGVSVPQGGQNDLGAYEFVP